MLSVSWFKPAMIVGAVLSLSAVAIAQFPPDRPELDVPYVPTRPPVVEKMLDMGEVGEGDYVIDLGSGDGRILVAAAKRGARGFGVDIDPQRISEANENARAAGVQDRISFRQADLFKTDFSKADVLTMYLLPDVNLRLRPVILDTLKPGTRIVSHAFSMDDWGADETAEVDGATVYLWIVPAKVQGRWTLTESGGRTTPVEIRQSFQTIEGTAGKAALRDGKLTGDMIRFTIDTGGGARVYEGQVKGDRIDPVATPSPSSATPSSPTPARGWRLTRAG